MVPVVRKHVKSDLLTYQKHDPWESQMWAVAEAYEQRDGRIFPAGEASRPYFPFKTPELPTELQRVSTGELSPLEFVQQFGLLGYGNFRGFREECDPVDWIMAHA